MPSWLARQYIQKNRAFLVLFKRTLCSAANQQLREERIVNYVPFLIGELLGFKRGLRLLVMKNMTAARDDRRKRTF
jgi:hypothetical protein